jgi:hypothetical protein
VVGKTNKTAPKKLGPTKKEIESLDLDPDAWPKFEKLIRESSKKPRPRQG